MMVVSTTPRTGEWCSGCEPSGMKGDRKRRMLNEAVGRLYGSLIKHASTLPRRSQVPFALLIVVGHL